MKKVKILSVLCALILAYAFLSFSVFAVADSYAAAAMNGRTVGESIVGEDSAVSTENGNSIGTKETDTTSGGDIVGDAVSDAVTNVEDMLTPDDTGNGNTLGDTDGDGVVEGDGSDMGDGLMPDENISDNEDGSIESGDGSDSGIIEEMTPDDTESVAQKTSSWLGIIITLIIVVAVVCLIVVFIPKKKN